MIGNKPSAIHITSFISMCYLQLKSILLCYEEVLALRTQLLGTNTGEVIKHLSDFKYVSWLCLALCMGFEGTVTQNAYFSL